MAALWCSGAALCMWLVLHVTFSNKPLWLLQNPCEERFKPRQIITIRTVSQQLTLIFHEPAHLFIVLVAAGTHLTTASNYAVLKHGFRCKSTQRVENVASLSFLFFFSSSPSAPVFADTSSLAGQWNRTASPKRGRRGIILAHLHCDV